MNDLVPFAALSATESLPPLDRLGRSLRDLRISVMDRCNFRCPYCMPESTYHPDFAFLDATKRLDFDEIVRLARLFVELGVGKIRLTGGEPLLRPGLAQLVARLKAIDGVDDLAMTTNGVLLARHAAELRAAGLDRVTVSLDTLDSQVFARMSGGRADLQAVLDGIEAARAAGFPGGIKLNAVVMRGVNQHGIEGLVERFRGTGIVTRFIEYMDVGNHNDWRPEAIVPSSELLARIAARWPLVPVSPNYRGEVASRYRFVDGAGEIGFISSVSAPFCGDCSRARLSSDGKLYTCLFATQGSDLRGLLRAGADDDTLRARLRAVWTGRSDRYSEARAAQRAAPAGKIEPRKIEMHYIGG